MLDEDEGNLFIVSMVGRAVQTDLSPAAEELSSASADGKLSDGSSVFLTHAVDTSLEYDIYDKVQSRPGDGNSEQFYLHRGRKPGAKLGIYPEIGGDMA